MFYLSALLMGLAGGPHCVAMCSAACGAVGRTRAWQFQVGRLLGYSIFGALAAATAQSLAWVAGHNGALQMLWAFFHIAVFAWGLLLIIYARQPAWASGIAKAAWAQVKPVAQARGGVFISGFLWTVLPCGLLYSALLLASLAGNAWQGAGVMVLFGLGSGVWLGAAPWLWRRLHQKINQDWGMRASGALLCGATGWALWMDVGQRVAVWCR